MSVRNNGNLIEKSIYQNQEIYKAEKSEFRFKADKNLKINPPSEVIHVSNIKQEYFKESYLHNLFSQHGTIVAMK